MKIKKESLSPIEAYLRKGAELGKSQAEMAREYPYGNHGHENNGVSRERIRQLLQSHGLHEQWAKNRRQVSAAAKAKRAAAKQSAKRTLLESFASEMARRGYRVTRTMDGAPLLEGHRISIHMPLQPNPLGRYTTHSKHTNRVRILLLPNGRYYMFLPKIGPKANTLSVSVKKAGLDQDELLPRGTLRATPPIAVVE